MTGGKLRAALAGLRRRPAAGKRWRGLAAGTLVPVAQPEGAVYASKLGPADRVLDWGAPAVRLDRQVRALDPVPGARAQFPLKGRSESVKVWRARPVEAPLAPAGTVLGRSTDGGVRRGRAAAARGCSVPGRPATRRRSLSPGPSSVRPPELSCPLQLGERDDPHARSVIRAVRPHPCRRPPWGGSIGPGCGSSAGRETLRFLKIGQQTIAGPMVTNAAVPRRVRAGVGRDVQGSGWPAVFSSSSRPALIVMSVMQNAFANVVEFAS